MKIADIRATTVSVPLEAPLLHASGAHWGRFVRTIVEVETDDGLVWLGGMGGGGESAESTFEGLKSYLVGHNPFELEALRFMILNPTASLYNNRAQLHAAIEFGCLDLMGQQLGVPVHTLLGGKVREEHGFTLPCCTLGPRSPISPSLPMRTTIICKTTLSTEACSSTRVALSRSPRAPGWGSAWTGTSWTNTHSSTRSWEDILTTGTPDTRAVTPSCPSSASRTHTGP